jgi:3-oxoacyl-[acyl-carrier protein] reductase
MKKISMKVAVVTGGASGIGRAVSLKLSEEGHHVVVCDINLKGAKSIAGERPAGESEILSKYLDVSKPKMVKSVFKKIFQKYGRIDILVNSAGNINPATPLVLKKEEDFRRIIDVHLMGTFYCTREAASYMIRRKFGRIVNMSSRSGVYGLYGNSDYSAAKAGIIGLSQCAAKELYKKGITVNVIAPAGIRSPMLLGGYGSSMSMATQKRHEARLDMVVGEPRDVANLVSFLTREDSDLINGAVIIFDAGGHLWHGSDEAMSKVIGHRF